MSPTLALARAELTMLTRNRAAALAYVTGTVPAHPALVALAMLLGAALGCAAAFVTAAFTRTAEAANITMLPVLAALLGGGIWALTTAPGEITWAMRASGGKALAELVRLGWSGLDGGAVGAGSSVLALLALTAGAVLVARRTFRWEPRS